MKNTKQDHNPTNPQSSIYQALLSGASLLEMQEFPKESVTASKAWITMKAKAVIANFQKKGVDTKTLAAEQLVNLAQSIHSVPENKRLNEASVKTLARTCQVTRKHLVNMVVQLETEISKLDDKPRNNGNSGVLISLFPPVAVQVAETVKLPNRLLLLTIIDSTLAPIISTANNPNLDLLQNAMPALVAAAKLYHLELVAGVKAGAVKNKLITSLRSAGTTDTFTLAKSTASNVRLAALENGLVISGAGPEANKLELNPISALYLYVSSSSTGHTTKLKAKEDEIIIRLCKKAQAYARHELLS